jgi:hypothetical protein
MFILPYTAEYGIACLYTPDIDTELTRRKPLKYRFRMNA